MKFIEIKKYGGPEVLTLSNMATPSPGPGQVLIKVSAAGINRPDIVQRQGNYPPPAGASSIPGLEVAGEVIATGENVNTPAKGEQVCALLTGGGYAEYAVAEAELCLPVPAGLSLIEAAAIPETFFTVWSNLIDRAGLKKGETILIHGGSSGIGTTATQIAKIFAKANVFITAGNKEKCDTCLSLGADHAINYQTQDYVEEIKSLTNNRGVDVILDMVVGDYMQKNIAVTAEEGRIIIIAGLQGFKTEVNFAPVMLKRLTITGSTLRSRNVAFKAAIAKKLKQHIWPLLESGKIKPIVHKIFSLEQAAEAHCFMESGQHIGKIILKV